MTITMNNRNLNIFSHMLSDGLWSPHVDDVLDLYGVML